MSSGQVTIGSGTPILIISQNSNRKSLIITNEGLSKIYIGGDSSITTATAISIESGGKHTEDSGGQRMYLGDIYGIAEDATNDCRYWERV